VLRHGSVPRWPEDLDPVLCSDRRQPLQVWGEALGGGSVRLSAGRRARHEPLEARGRADGQHPRRLSRRDTVGLQEARRLVHALAAAKDARGAGEVGGQLALEHVQDLAGACGRACNGVIASGGNKPSTKERLAFVSLPETCTMTNVAASSGSAVARPCPQRRSRSSLPPASLSPEESLSVDRERTRLGMNGA
jgi:hypothetical protein